MTTDRDPTLDMALRLIGSADPPTPTDDDAKFAKRVAAALGQRKAKPSEIDDALAAPLPDDHRDAAPIAHDAVEEAEVVEEHGDAAYAADEQHGEDKGWEGAISRPPQSGPVSALDGLARLTRSGPHPSVRPPTDDAGMAKGPDSGLIDLRGLAQSGEKEAAKDDVVELSELARAAPAALKPAPMPSAPPATSTSAAVSPTSAAKSAPTSAAAAASSRTRKSNTGLWIGVTTFAAAAAFGVFFLNMNKRSAPTSDNRSADVAAAKASTPATGAPTAAATTEESPTVLASASAAPPDESATVATNDDNTPPNSDDVQKTAAGTKKPPQMANPPPTVATKDTAAAKPTATATTTATTGTPTKSNGSGSLDDVLGLNKPAVPTATVAVTPDLPDKPEQIDIRSAVNSRVGAASACVAGLDGASKVTISFSPAGTVSGVVVTSGPAKGTGAEACIKSAFSSAKVPRSKLGGTGFTSLGGP